MNSLYLTAAILLLIAVRTEGRKRLVQTKEVVNECTKTVRCERIYELTFFSGITITRCEIQLNVELSERNCRIIFTEPSNKNVTWLDIIGELEALPDLSDVVKKFKNLKTLEFSNTKLKTVKRARVAVLSRIPILKFNRNSIDKLEVDTFDNLRNLKEFRFHQSKLEIIPEGLFRNNQKLQTIDLSYNKIKEIHPDLFKELGDLRYLYLYYNRLEIIPEGLFRNNEKLETIDLNYNKIKEIHPNLFKELGDLRYLYLDNNQLKNLPKRLFRNNQKLEEISFQNNKIKTIETDFKNLPSLWYFDLSYNICIDERIWTSHNSSIISEMQQKIKTKCSRMPKCSRKRKCKKQSQERRVRAGS